jgi:hypothetical protein
VVTVEGVGPDMEAIRMLLEVQERRASMVGLDAPAELKLGWTEVEEVGPGEQVVLDVEQFAEVIDIVAVHHGRGSGESGEPREATDDVDVHTGEADT